MTPTPPERPWKPAWPGIIIGLVIVAACALVLWWAVTH